MHRWFFADDEILCRDSVSSSSSSPQITIISSTSSVPEADWTFKVKFNWNLCFNETLAICGSCASLGDWDTQQVVPLIQNEDSTLWMVKISLPSKNYVYYRYLVCALSCSGRRIVRFWEADFEARTITPEQMQNINVSIDEYDIFGSFNNKLKIERGWLDPCINVVQLKFYKAPFVLTMHEPNSCFQVKITPLKLKSASKKNSQEDLNETFAYCEVATLQEQTAEFCKQSKYGTPFGTNYLVLFNLTVDDIQHTAYLIDFYKTSLKSETDVPPYHFGYQYIFPEVLKNSRGTLHLTIMCGTKHRPIGTIECEYLVVKPLLSHEFTLEKTFERYWSSKHETLHIGHRGCGKSFWLQKNILRENAINSLQLAIAHGADLLEIDVHLTNDMIPIVWHDFLLQVTKNLNVDAQTSDIMQLQLTDKEIEKLKSAEKRIDKDLVSFPVSRFTVEQLSRVKVYEPPKEPGCISDNKNNQPFATLEQLLKVIEPKTGFVIDIKWPQILIHDNKKECLCSDFDKNDFVDAILNVILTHAGERRIILTSFDADICTMVRLKQNLYPIMFLIQAETSPKKFRDPRGRSISTGMYFAKVMNLLGVVVNCEDLLKAPTNVANIRKRDLYLMTWGEETRSADTRKYLATLGVNGIVYDRINHVFQPKDLERIIFYIVEIKKTKNE